MRNLFYFFCFSALLFGVFAYQYYPPLLWIEAALIPIIALGLFDVFQMKHSIRRNFPVIGHFRYLLENIRPEINQYFIESNSDGVPFSRELRSIVYQRSKLELDTLPFGTQMDVYKEGYEWTCHSLMPKHIDPESLRVTFGGEACKQPYSASIFNVSAMSYGSLSTNAVLALNGGAKMGNFAHNTGEGGLSPYHLQPGGDIIWQIGTAYFGCRDKAGNFSPEHFKEKSQLPQVKMIEVKLSQGAKPGHGGILPAAKLTPEIAQIRGVAMGMDVISPPAHSAFSTPIEMMEFISELRELSGGKPVGFKLCLGKKREFMAIAKAMVKTGIYPDFITLDGGEGGTGAAPIEFSNFVGFPMRDGLTYVHNVLVGFDIRKKMRIIASGKTVNGFDLLTKFALGADTCNAARAMMMALGCIQALRCNTNQCPTGVATQNPVLVKGLNVTDKARRVANFHKETIKSVAELIGAMGLSRPSDVLPRHLFRRISNSEIKNLSELYPFIDAGTLLGRDIPEEYANAFKYSSAESFSHSPVEIAENIPYLKEA